MEYMETPLPPSTLKVDFTWRKLRFLITDPTERNSMIVHVKMTSPSLVFCDSNDSQLATGVVHLIKIDAEAQIGTSPAIRIKALKRFETAYTHPSRAYARPGQSTMTMTWTSGCNFKNWDFVCLDEDQQPVARFSSNVWAVKKVGFIEFMGDKADDPAAREEIAVVGLTVYYNMLSRINNPFQLFGAVASKPGYPKNEEAEEGGHELQIVEASTSGRDGDAKMAHARVVSKSSENSSMRKSVEQ